MAEHSEAAGAPPLPIGTGHQTGTPRASARQDGNGTPVQLDEACERQLTRNRGSECGSVRTVRRSASGRSATHHENA
jgi:hypothetical protein